MRGRQTLGVERHAKPVRRLQKKRRDAVEEARQAPASANTRRQLWSTTTQGNGSHALRIRSILCTMAAMSGSS